MAAVAGLVLVVTSRCRATCQALGSREGLGLHVGSMSGFLSRLAFLPSPGVLG